MASVSKREWTYKGVTKSAYEVRYKDGQKHRSKSFRLFRDADAFRKKVERELEDGNHTADTETITIAKLAEIYIRDAEQRVKDGRLGRSRATVIKQALDKHIVPYIGGKLVSRLSWSDIEETHKRMLHAGLAPLTARRYIDFIRMMEAFASKRGWTKKALAAEFGRDLRGIGRPRVRTFKTEEIKQLLAEVDKDRHVKLRQDFTHIYRCFVHIATYCGLRYGEIAGLTVKSLDFNSKTLKVRHNLTCFNELKTPKTRAGVRDVPMPDHVCAMLKQWLDKHYRENDRELVFTTLSGSPIMASSFHRDGWRPLLKRCQLWSEGEPVPHFHALRHYTGSLWIALGMPLPEVAAGLGHHTFDMTLQVYAHEITGGHDRQDLVSSMTALLNEPESFTQGLRSVA